MNQQQRQPAGKEPLKEHNKHLKITFAPAVFATIISLSLAATTCGTFAWFAYAAHANASYDGVTIGSRDIQVGYVSALKFDEYSQFELEEEAISENKYIYWFKGNATTQPLAMLISLSGYAYDLLKPVTTGKYAQGDNFSLYSAPVKGRSYSEDDIADHKNYTQIPLAFRVESDTEPGVYLPNNDVYMSIAEVTSVYEIKEAMRIYSDDLNAHTHLINPTAETDGKDTVGGVLDLDKDEYYDNYVGEDGNTYETFYGEFNNDLAYYDSPRESDSEQVGDWTTFNAKHQAGVYQANLEASSPKTADFESMFKYEHKYIPVTSTRVETNNYGYLTLSIYVEGWDTTVTDYETKRAFTLDLQFEVIID